MLRSRGAEPRRAIFEREPDAAPLRFAIELGEVGAMRGKFLGRRRKNENRRQRRRSIVERSGGRRAKLDRERFLAAGHREVDLGEELGIEQRPVQGALRVRHAETLAQRIEAVLLTRELIAGERQRVDHFRRDGRGRRQIEPLHLFVEESEIERRVVDDPARSACEIDELGGDVGEFRLVAQRLPGQPVDVGGAAVDLALGIDIEVHVTTSEPAINHLDAGDLDDAVAQLRIEAGGFGVEDDVAHQRR